MSYRFPHVSFQMNTVNISYRTIYFRSDFDKGGFILDLVQRSLPSSKGWKQLEATVLQGVFRTFSSQDSVPSLTPPAGSRMCCSFYHRRFFLKCVLIVMPSAAWISSFFHKPSFLWVLWEHLWSPESHAHTFLGTSLSNEISCSCSAIEWQSCYGHF